MSSLGTTHHRDTTFTKIFVGGLPYHTSDYTLRSYFEPFGDITEAVVITDRQTGKSRGYGFVSVQSFNPLIATLKPQSNGPSYSNTVIGTLAVDGWAVTLYQMSFGTAMRGLGWAADGPGPFLAVSNVTAHPSTVSVRIMRCNTINRT